MLEKAASDYRKLISFGLFLVDWLHPKTFSIKNRYYDRKVRESLETDMAVVRYGQDKVLNRDNENFVKTNAWKPLFKKMKTLH